MNSTVNIYTNALITLYGNLILATIHTNSIAKIGFFILATLSLVIFLTPKDK